MQTFDPAWDSPRQSGAEPSPPGDALSRAPLSELPARELASLFSFSQQIVSALSHPARAGQLFGTIAEGIARIAGPASAAVCLLEEDALRVRTGTGLLADWEGEWLPLEGSFEGAAVLSRAPQVTPDLASDPRAYLARERGVTVGPALALPLTAGDLAVGAVLLARAPGAPPFAPEEVERLRPAERMIAAAVENSRAFERARRSRERLLAWRGETEARARLAGCEHAGRAGDSPGEEAAEAVTSVKQVLRAVRHEVNNPLAVILGEIQLLSRADPLSQGDGLRGIVETIRKEAHRLQTFTRRLAALESMPGDPTVDERGILEFPDDGD